MKALIVAAGLGSRLREVSPSKPLTSIAGVPMIARVIAAARAGGATSFAVVIGHEGDRLQAFLHELDPTITCVTTADWNLPNGYSVLTGAGAIGPERHLLMMADHLCEPAIIARMIAAPAVPLALAIDRRLDNPLIDLDDVTRVRTNGDRIVAIGKHLPDYDSFDCGIFAVDGRFHSALRDVIARGGAGSISAGVEALAATGDAHAVDIGEAWWLDVDDARALAQAEAAVADQRPRDAALPA
ncbi:NTP transferase domain-containing protein [Sphingomonas mucosissima]|uniref:Bifunctional IPC transferase and DIPP synthase n=1 Tax=Sphingomonas mucosissima TaxID=370959 RepID=A0A245ZT31_9SPHN|nr:NTP transferase domain-containing protein [Sphingomonas mucosissima]OWK32904.1 bifunctional IPC transferase and DIPP synthase [Sphingomonas mucosissima]